MTAEANRTRRQRRVAAVDNAYRKSLRDLHGDYQKVYDAALRAHGLTLEGLHTHLALPQAFHDAVEEARAAFMAGHALVQQARHSSASRLPRKM